MDKIKLDILAISYSKSQSGAYALILGEHKGKRRLPIIIGAFEAQAIAIALENMKSTRPLTHDLFKIFGDTFNIIVKEVIINKFVEGVFFAKLICTQDDNKKEFDIDSRTSDAVALAVRYNCPIYTYESIFKVAGIIMEEEPASKKQPVKKEEKIAMEDETEKEENEFANLSITQLKKKLDTAVQREAYELASKIRDAIKEKEKIKKK